MASLEKRDLANAIPKLESSFQIDQNPETAYFLAQAQMQQGDCQSAIQSFNLVLENKGTVVEDSVASLIPLAEYNLSICYGKLGQSTESDKHFLAASTMWANADPDVNAKLTRLSTGSASPQHRYHPPSPPPPPYNVLRRTASPGRHSQWRNATTVNVSAI